MTAPDSRLHAFRDDIADIRLKGRVDSRRWVEGRRMQVTEPLVTVHKAPRFDAMQLTQALMGETLLCFDVAEGWAFVQLDADGYVGYVAAHALSDRVEQGTHRVAVPATHIYTAASIKTQPAVAVTMNAVVNVVSDDGKFARLSDGRFMFLRHLWPVGEHEPDFVSVAERFLHVPYYWGGKSVHGIDCSGLVQLSLAAAGIACLRDSDMQESSLGTVLGLERLDDLRRGDLVFWSGHVGIMTDTETLLHANGHHMMVVAEPLRAAMDRIAANYGRMTALKRLQ